jgi:secreted Zn-dependent insulinase-like peptidase
VEVDDLLTELVVDMTSPYARLPQDLLRARYVANHWNPEGISELLNHFTPRNCHIALSSSLFGGDDDEEEEEEEEDEDDDDEDYDYDEESLEEEEELLTQEEELALLSTLPEAHKALSTRPGVSSKSGEAGSSSLCQSKHFQMSYWKDLISEELLSDWDDGLQENSLHLPAPNQYIPTDFKILKPKSQEIPEIIFTSPTVRVWHLSAPRFHIPKSVVCLSLLSDYLLQVTSQDSDVPPSPSVFVFHDLLSRIVSDFLLQELYVAEMAYLDSKIVSRMNGIVISIYGFHDKMLSLASLVLRAFSNDDLLANERIVSQQIEKLKKDYLNDSLLSAEAANAKRLEILLPHQVPKPLRLEALQQLCCPSKKKKFIQSLKKYLKDFLASCRCEIFVQGNISVQSAVAFGKSVRTELERGQPSRRGKGKSVASTQNSHKFVTPSSVFVRPIEPFSSLRIAPKSPVERNVCCQLYFQVGPTNTRDYALLQLVQRIMEEPLFNELRTQKQVQPVPPLPLP